MRSNLQMTRWILLTLAAVGALSSSLAEDAGSATTVVRSAPYEDRKGEGKALVAEIIRRAPPENTQVMGVLRIRQADDTITEVPTKMSVRIVDGGWHDIYETQPAGGRAGEILVVQHQAGQANIYFHVVLVPQAERPDLAPIERAKLYQPLGGSDFYFADLGLEFLHWPEQRIIKKEMRKSRACRVVESVNPEPAAGAYSRVLSWLDVETGNIIRAEAYDAKGALLKEFSIRKISRGEGKVQVKEMEIWNEQNESRTRLEFNLEIKE